MNASASKPFVVGLTGGIGSGKSAASAVFASLGIQVVDADVIARQVVETGCPALEKIAAHFGQEILLENGALDRAALRAIVFANPAEREWLESLLHPLIREEIERQLAQSTSAYSVLSSPLLLETGQNKFVDTVLLIDATEQTQIARTTLRDGTDARAVEAIMNTQWSREKRRRHADHILLNEGAPEDLRESIATLHHEFLEQAALCRQMSEEVPPQ